MLFFFVRNVHIFQDIQGKCLLGRAIILRLFIGLFLRFHNLLRLLDGTFNGFFGFWLFRISLIRIFIKFIVICALILRIVIIICCLGLINDLVGYVLVICIWVRGLVFLHQLVQSLNFIEK